ncbi:hypothetical protein Mal64_13540 [Pseudobythopirellula maris]|uniref:Uncharacterized protein n=1 Tax=Pseudobythopirellula maris TaxID=2527991 RepID=A0A5C5ZV15_9BACT|nr:hypothetical protein [Pseudobythopirellula maris]TWT90955.1 hypothetical protein Mal64_13540 [Pseudobythopirellula maris]
MATIDDSTTNDSDCPAAPGRGGRAESWRSFVRSAAEGLGLVLELSGSEFRAVAPSQLSEDETPSRSKSGLSRIWPLGRSRAGAEPEPADNGGELLATSPEGLVDALLTRLAEREPPAGLRPLGQPDGVHGLAERLFAAYRLEEGGRCHVAGCSLEDAPFLRLTRRVVAPGVPQDETTVEHTFYNESVAAVASELIDRLGLATVETAEPAPHSVPRVRMGQIAAAAHRLAEAHADSALPVAVAIVWAKRASGRLRFEFGERSLDAPFDGWARDLEAPPVVCPRTGLETYSLGVLEDGDIVAAEAIQKSDVTGAKRLADELLTCAVTGKRGEAEHYVACPVLEAPVLATETTNCPRCGQGVARTVADDAGCDGCRKPAPLAADDPLRAELTERHPGLAKQKWSVAESGDIVLLEQTGWFRKTLVVLSRETLDPLRVATASRMSNTWRPLGAADTQRLLGG